MKKYPFFHIWGGGGALRRTQVNENFRAVRPHNRADICITREKNNHQFFIYGPQYKTKLHFWLFGGTWVAHRYSDQADLSQLSSHLYQSTYKIWNQSDKDFLSYRVNDETRTRRRKDD